MKSGAKSRDSLKPQTLNLKFETQFVFSAAPEEPRYRAKRAPRHTKWGKPTDFWAHYAASYFSFLGVFLRPLDALGGQGGQTLQEYLVALKAVVGLANAKLKLV